MSTTSTPASAEAEEFRASRPKRPASPGRTDCPKSFHRGFAFHFFLVTGGGAGTSVSGGKSPCSFLLPANQVHLTIVRIPRLSTLVTVIFGPPDFNFTRSPILNGTVRRSFVGDLGSYLKKPRNLSVTKIVARSPTPRLRASRIPLSITPYRVPPPF
jgi:hypothetical protein